MDRHVISRSRPLKDGHTEKSRLPALLKGGDSSGGKKQVALLDSLPNSLPAETANHGTEVTY